MDVTVTTPAGTSATSAADLFTYYAPATVTGLSPTSGPTAGGTLVTITGTNFSGVTFVKFGGTAATLFTVSSATSITAVAPARGAGSVHVRVTTSAGTSVTSAADRYTYVSPPIVRTVRPASGPTAGGTRVAITGSNFSGATAVRFGASVATLFTVNSSTSITAVAPAGTLGSVDITVTTSAGTSANSAADRYTYTYSGVAAVTGLSPNGGPTTGGTLVTITGANFSGATAVSFGATAATLFTVDSATSIRAVAPAGAAGSVDVRVTNPAGTTPPRRPIDTPTSLLLRHRPQPERWPDSRQHPGDHHRRQFGQRHRRHVRRRRCRDHAQERHLDHSHDSRSRCRQSGRDCDHPGWLDHRGCRVYLLRERACRPLDNVPARCRPLARRQRRRA